jgi:Holliday junction resolvase RusA-like endonuclease
MNKDLALSSFEYSNEEKWFRVVLKCTELVSVNSAHGMNRKGIVYDEAWTKRFKSEMRDQLIFCDPVKHCPWITSNATYTLAIKYVLKQYFWSRDLDNLHKYTQDMIADSCHINDSHITDIHIWKNFRPGDYE